MSRFIHIDHCLCRFGGHEYDYAVNLLEAAEAAGYDVALATNRRFRDGHRLPRHWPVYPVFPRTAYSKHCVWYGGHRHLPLDLNGRQLPRSTPAGHGNGWGQVLAAGTAAAWGWPGYRDRRRCIHGFAAACRRLFEEIELHSGDHVFFATFTEFDLLGLASYLRDRPASQAANWHLQFHFGLSCDNLPEGFAREHRRQAVKTQFENTLSHLPHHRVAFYNTTQALAAEYNGLQVGRFRYLPYPASPALQDLSATTNGPLRITCAGAVRRDKRIRDLTAIAKTVRADPFFDRKIKLVAQLPKRKVRRLGISPLSATSERADVAFETLGHPLERDAYHDLVRRADIGLLLHDGRRYASQCSGVLHELLAAGKPVIVPAGSWLAEQVAEPIFRHVETLRAGLPCVGHVGPESLAWRRTGDGSSVGPVESDQLKFTDTSEVKTTVPLPESATEMVVGFQRVDECPWGTYASVRTRQFDVAGNVVSRFESVLGKRPASSPLLTMFHLDPRATRVELRLRGAYRSQEIGVAGMEIDFLHAAGHGGCPAGSVGLIAAHPGQIPDLLRDMVAHYPHYRETADAFSRTWRQVHHPSQSIKILTTARDDGARQAAA